MNSEVQLSLDEGVAEVLGLLTGLDLQYMPNQDRYQSIVRQINRALRSVALEREWSHYASLLNVGTTTPGMRSVQLSDSKRPRIIGDDAVQLVDTSRGDHHVAEYAYFLPRDAIYKYQGRAGLWVAITRSTLQFSRPLTLHESGLEIHVPVMREPTKFRLPAFPEDPDEALPDVPLSTRQQLIDFPYPDLVVLKAAFFYAQTDPVMQPRVQTIEAQYKDLMYQIIEREERMTDSPYLNEFFVPVQNGLVHPGSPHHPHPHSDERR